MLTIGGHLGSPTCLIDIMRKKYFLKLSISFLTIFLFLFLPLTTIKADSKTTILEGLNKTANNAGIETSSDVTANTLANSIGVIINYLFGLLGVVFLTVVLVGGYVWLTAGGNEENIGKAKKWVINGINGMIVIFLAYALVYVILFALNQAVTNPPDTSVQIYDPAMPG